MDLTTWLKGLLAAAIAAASNGVLLIFTDPTTFNVATAGGWKRIGIVCGVSALVATAMYLKQSPLPAVVSSSTITVTKEVSNTPVPPE